MLTFTLAISCLTTSNLPWFMDLTFQVPMQYCSLQHQTLLPSPIASKIGCCFYFGSVSSFFLELFLHWSPVAYLTECGPLEKGKSNQFSILAVTTPWTGWKGKKIGHWKMKSPGQKPDMLLENSGEITLERIKRASQGKTNTQLWMWLVIEVKSDAVKNTVA